MILKMLRLLVLFYRNGNILSICPNFHFFLAKQSVNHRCGKKYLFLYVKLNDDVRTGLASRDDKNE